MFTLYGSQPIKQTKTKQNKTQLENGPTFTLYVSQPIKQAKTKQNAARKWSDVYALCLPTNKTNKNETKQNKNKL